MVWIGIRPTDFTQYSEVQVQELLESSNEKRLAIQQSAESEELPQWASNLYDVTDELASKIENQ
jgi:NADH-quinone oxidoreductase subunit M